MTRHRGCRPLCKRIPGSPRIQEQLDNHTQYKISWSPYFHCRPVHHIRSAHPLRSQRSAVNKFRPKTAHQSPFDSLYNDNRK